MKVGLVGAKLGHSYSKIIHERLYDCNYQLFEKDEDSLKEMLLKKDFDAINVTIPYKQFVIDFCDVVDEKATAIHAVNAIVKKNGKLYATNTDFDGLKKLIQDAKIEIEGKTCCILGTGGTSNTAKAVLQDMKARQIYIAGRNKTHPIIGYQDLEQYQDIQIFVQTTSVGMYPNNDEQIIDLVKFKNLEAIIDVVYNPLQTKICQQAEALGIRHINGLKMLVAQAKAAAEFFLDQKIPDEKVEAIYQQILKQQRNLVLIGMPASGKSTIGKLLSEKSGRKLIELDEEIEKAMKMTIPEIFEKLGEDKFREMETIIAKKYAKENNLVISCGGGIILKDENMKALKQNGLIIELMRKSYAVGNGRPLNSSVEKIKEMEKIRRPLYDKYRDVQVDNQQDIATTMKQLEKYL